jgi:hypothetical protein
MFSILTTQTFLTILYTGQVLWHSAAFTYFGLWPEHTILIGSRRKRSLDSTIRSTPGGDDWHHDLLTYLGFINSGFALLAGLRVFRIPSTGTYAGDVALDMLALTVLGWANGSQAYLDLTRIRKSDRWKITGFDFITILDTLFIVLDFASVAALMTASSV